MSAPAHKNLTHPPGQIVYDRPLVEEVNIYKQIEEEAFRRGYLEGLRASKRSICALLAPSLTSESER